MIMGVYCVGRVHNSYIGSILVMGAYCIGYVYNILPWKYHDNGSILCR